MSRDVRSQSSCQLRAQTCDNMLTHSRIYDMDFLRFRYIVFCFLHVFIRLPPCPCLSIYMLVHLWET